MVNSNAKYKHVSISNCEDVAMLVLAFSSKCVNSTAVHLFRTVDGLHTVV